MLPKPFLAAAVALSVLGLTACGGDIATAAPAPTSTTTAAPTSTVDPAAAIMIDPDGDRWNLARTIREARQLAESVREAGGRLPANFCEQGYIEGLEGGASFPAGKQAWLDACKEGVRTAE
ncbi:hypothetical protein ACFVMC_23040 [Nocardia sp. NPDC127579]|uniref:hypothetical protein n=1 Tax=Nocardia sp. NPDC127579 TaxID=3345402 RepID=UPI00363A7C6E